MTVTLRFRAGFEKRLAWGLPDAPLRELCAICAGPLPAVPLMLWKDDGSGASLCDKCVNEWIEAVPK